MAYDEQSDAFRASLVAKIAAWTAVLESYDAAVSLDGRLSEPTENGRQDRQKLPDGGKPIDLPVGIFRDKSLREAIEIYLGAGRRKQKNHEIALGLQKGGIATTSKFFEATVATALGRMREDGDVLRFPDGWDLAASYPESLRNRLDKDTKAPKARKGKKAKARPAQKVAKTGRRDKTTIIKNLIMETPNGQTVRDLVTGLQVLGTDASKDYIRVVTRRLLKRGEIQVQNGKFYSPYQAVI